MAKTTQMRCAKWVLNNDRMSKISILPCCREKTSELLLDRKKTTARKKCPTPYLITLPEAPTLKFSFFLTPFLLPSGPFSKFKTLTAQTGLGSNKFSRVTWKAFQASLWLRWLQWGTYPCQCWLKSFNLKEKSASILKPPHVAIAVREAYNHHKLGSCEFKDENQRKSKTMWNNIQCVKHKSK